jgi:hypothetical protein
MEIAIDNNDGGYRATTNYGPVRDRVIKARLLERLRDFLSPVRLPRSVGVLAAECPGGSGTGPFYNDGNRTITICYQFVAFVENWADKIVTAAKKDPKTYPFPITRDEVIWGLLGSVVLHESGHALFDVLNVPVFGREEDAADQFAMLIALRLRPQLAEAAVKSYAYFWHTMRDPDGGMKDGKLNDDFSDEHGTPSQRTSNGLCVAYGHSPAVFGKFVTAGWLPQQRAKGCAQEYAQLAAAFDKTILPFIDPKRMAAMEKIDWLSASYGPAPVTAPPGTPAASQSTKAQAPSSGKTVNAAQ